MILALITILAVCHGTGWLFRRWGQPAVIGEIFGGLLLGPSFLGHFFPDLQSTLISFRALSALESWASLGVVLYMFLVGLEFDLGKLKESKIATWTISHTSIIVPFILGILISLPLHEHYSFSNISAVTFALFIGVSLSVTAFPVLARIIQEKNMKGSPLGRLALACAAIDDVTAWCLLALVAGLSRTGQMNIIWVILGTVAFVLFMFLGARPVLQKILKNQDRSFFLPLLLFALACAYITELIGIHALFGAFLAGVIIPSEHHASKQIELRCRDFVRLIMLPLFFAFSGLRTQVLLLDSAEDWMWCGIIILVAIAGKFGGTMMAARWTKHSWKDSTTLGILMNTRGLVELVVLNVGLDLQIITPRLFSMLVLMALVTTFMTSPLLSLQERRACP